MTALERRYDIDWLRVITIGLLLIYHIAIVFQPWGLLIGFIQSKETMESLWIPMQMLNIWRIPILFFVSGMGVCFAMQKRNWKSLLLERTIRIFVPLIFGMLAIVPLHIVLLQKYYNLNVGYHPGLGHLWFLANIFVYVIILLPVFVYLKSNRGLKVVKVLNYIYSKPLGLLLVIGPFAIEAIVIAPSTYEMYAQTWHGFFLGLLAFFFGFTFILNGGSFWSTLKKWWWLFLIMAVSLYAARLIFFNMQSHGMLMAMESILWIYSIFGLSQMLLNKPSKKLSYLSKSAYPIYIIHMAFLYLAAYVFLPISMPVILKFICIILFTFAGCFITYELLIRRISFIRPLFGLNRK